MAITIRSRKTSSGLRLSRVLVDQGLPFLVWGRLICRKVPAGTTDITPRRLSSMRDVIAMQPEIALTAVNEYGVPEAQVVPYWNGAGRGSELCRNFQPDHVIRLMQAPAPDGAPAPRTLGLLDRVYTKKAAVLAVREAVADGAQVAPDPAGYADRELERIDAILDRIDQLSRLVAPSSN